MKIIGEGAKKAYQDALDRFETAWYMMHSLTPDELTVFYNTKQLPQHIHDSFQWEGKDDE
jgi:hypothetical protein